MCLGCNSNLWSVGTVQVLDVLCSLCVCNGVAVRSNQHLICDNLLPGRDLLLQTRLINHVSRYTQNPTNTHTHTHILTCMLDHQTFFRLRCSSLLTGKQITMNLSILDLS